MSTVSEEHGWRRWLGFLPSLVLLTTVLIYGTGEKVHSRFQQIGEDVWPGYYQIRVDPVAPTCDPNAPVVVDSAAPAEDSGASDGEDDLGDLDDLDDIFGDDEGPTEEQKLEAARKALELCKSKHAQYEESLAKITTGVKVFRAFETSLGEVVKLGTHFSKHILVLLLLLSSIVTTLRREHIALRVALSHRDHLVSTVAQLATAILMLASGIAFWQIDLREGFVDKTPLHLIWILGFAGLVLANLYLLVKRPEGLLVGGNWGRAAASIPLFSYMGLITGIYFLVAEWHPAGLAIYMSKLTEHKMLYLAVGLYVWVGMLLKQTRLATLSFDIIRPFKMSPELLAFVVVAASALPTAYSGASGIFVIAAGGVIYQELKKAGARTSLALASTAMSGSIGVVLRPCLLVVIVASLNKQVTTDDLFGWGWKVYLLSILLFFLVVVLMKRGALSAEVNGTTLGQAGAGFKPLTSYIAIFVVIWAIYDFGFGAALNEHTASLILPVIMLFILGFDRWVRHREGEAEVDSFGHSCVDATSETTGHIGALLLMMCMSVCLGGIVERSEMMNAFPQVFDSPVMAMSVLVVVLVLIGMTMGPYGAVILVTASIADVAYKNGIDAVHFWMVVLVAFELGYLTPPVALNHLLTRQVVGGDDPEPEPGASFYARYERYLMPMLILATTLVITAFVPFAMTSIYP